MAVSFPSYVPLIIGEPSDDVSDDYVVRTLFDRGDTHTVVIVTRRYYHDVPFRKHVPMRQRWWHRKSPRQRIVEAQERAQRIADKLNWESDQAQHEFDLTVR